MKCTIWISFSSNEWRRLNHPWKPSITSWLTLSSPSTTLTSSLSLTSLSSSSSSSSSSPSSSPSLLLSYNRLCHQPHYFTYYHGYCCSSKKLATAVPKSIAWENSRHLTTLPLVSPRNDVWETSAEIPYWWRVTTQIWVVLLIGRAAWEIWFNQSEALSRSG